MRHRGQRARVPGHARHEAGAERGRHQRRPQRRAAARGRGGESLGDTDTSASCHFFAFFATDAYNILHVGFDPAQAAKRRTAWTSPRPRWSERRDLERVPLEIFLDEYVDDRPHRAVTTNISATGLYMHRVATRASRLFRRGSRHVQLEFALPGTRDTIWARGEIRYDELGMDLVHGTGVELVDMARAHQRLIRDYLYEQRKSKLQKILELVRKNRYH